MPVPPFLHYHRTYCGSAFWAVVGGLPQPPLPHHTGSVLCCAYLGCSVLLLPHLVRRTVLPFPLGCTVVVPGSSASVTTPTSYHITRNASRWRPLPALSSGLNTCFTLAFWFFRRGGRHRVCVLQFFARLDWRVLLCLVLRIIQCSGTDCCLLLAILAGFFCPSCGFLLFAFEHCDGRTCTRTVQH